MEKHRDDGELQGGHKEGQLLRGHFLREKGTIIFFGLGVREFFKQETEVPVRLQAAGLGCFNEAIEGGAGMGAVGMRRE